ncbi:hypothetical protein OUZ56_032327 [Daphnia magna]|uniref:Peptidase M66 domain-containing protein n=1 Tax=Daphnia magna TaxID=35525 RepID=A0ABR0B8L2_9CRUS|nr:hypothetical protein OUZ56_032327 [Daphnia magna]
MPLNQLRRALPMALGAAALAACGSDGADHGSGNGDGDNEGGVALGDGGAGGDGGSDGGGGVIPGSSVVVSLAQSHVVPAPGTVWSLAASAPLRVSEGRDALVLVQVNLPVTAPVLEVRQGETLVGSRPLNPPSQLPPSEGGEEKFSADSWSVTLPGAEVAPGMTLVVREGGRPFGAPVPVAVAPRTDITFQLLPFLLFGSAEGDSDLKQPTAAQKAQGAAGMPFTTSAFVPHPVGTFVSSFLVVPPDGTYPATKITNADGLTGRKKPFLDMATTITDAAGDRAINRVTYGSVYMKDAAGGRASYGGGVGWIGRDRRRRPDVWSLWHEGGHGMSLDHSPAEYDKGIYPYVDGSLNGSAWGFDASQNYFRAPFTTPNSYYFTCDGDKAERGGRPFAKDRRGRCYRFDPMHSAEDQKDPKASFPLYSDFNAARMPRWALGRDKINATNTGFMRIDAKGQWVDTPAASETTNAAWEGFHSGHADPELLNREWDLVFATRSVAGTADGTEFYQPLRHIGNGLKLVDPMVPSELASINADSNKATFYKYCRSSGCDYTLRATYKDPATQALTTVYRVLRGSARQWDKPSTWKDGAKDEKSPDSFLSWGIKLPVPAGRPKLTKLELLDTPLVWTRTANDLRNATVVKECSGERLVGLGAPLAVAHERPGRLHERRARFPAGGSVVANDERRLRHRVVVAILEGCEGIHQVGGRRRARGWEHTGGREGEDPARLHRLLRVAPRDEPKPLGEERPPEPFGGARDPFVGDAAEGFEEAVEGAQEVVGVGVDRLELTRVLRLGRPSGRSERRRVGGLGRRHRREPRRVPGGEPTCPRACARRRKQTGKSLNVGSPDIPGRHQRVPGASRGFWWVAPAARQTSLLDAVQVALHAAFGAEGVGPALGRRRRVAAGAEERRAAGRGPIRAILKEHERRAVGGRRRPGVLFGRAARLIDGDRRLEGAVGRCRRHEARRRGVCGVAQPRFKAAPKTCRRSARVALRVGAGEASEVAFVGGARHKNDPVSGRPLGLAGPAAVCKAPVGRNALGVARSVGNRFDGAAREEGEHENREEGLRHPPRRTGAPKRLTARSAFASHPGAPELQHPSAHRASAPVKRCSPFVARSVRFAAAGGRPENSGALPGDASLSGGDGSVSNEPSCIVGLPPFVAPAYAAPLPVEPQVLWTKPFGFGSYLERPNSPLVVTQDRIVLATQTAVYLYDRSGTLVVRRPLFGLDGGRVPLIAAPDGSIYVGSAGLDRIDKDGTSFRYFTSEKSIHAPDGEGGSWISGIARDPKTDRIYAVANDGWLRVVARAGENFAPVYLTTEPLSSAPTVLGIGDTLVVQGTLFHKNTGLRIGPSFVGNNGEVSFSLDAHGRRMIAPVAFHIPAFRFVDSCRQPIATIPQFGATARPTMTTFQDETLWAESLAGGESRYSVDINVTYERGEVVRKRLDFPAWPTALGADGTLYSLGKEDGKPIILATDEQFVERWRLPLATESAYLAGLGDDGVLVVHDVANKTFTAIQTTSPGFAPVARALADPTGAPRTPQNWIGAP